MGAALAHLQRADAHDSGHAAQAEHPAVHADPNHATRLSADGQRISRRTLRAAGIHGSNADLSTLARIITTQPAPEGARHSTRPLSARER